MSIKSRVGKLESRNKQRQIIIVQLREGESRDEALAREGHHSVGVDALVVFIKIYGSA